MGWSIWRTLGASGACLVLLKWVCVTLESHVHMWKPQRFHPVVVRFCLNPAPGVRQKLQISFDHFLKILLFFCFFPPLSHWNLSLKSVQANVTYKEVTNSNWKDFNSIHPFAHFQPVLCGYCLKLFSFKKHWHAHPQTCSTYVHHPGWRCVNTTLCHLQFLILKRDSSACSRGGPPNFLLRKH